MICLDSKAFLNAFGGSPPPPQWNKQYQPVPHPRAGSGIPTLPKVCHYWTHRIQSILRCSQGCAPPPPRPDTTQHTESRASSSAPGCAPPTPDLQLRTARQRNVGPRGARSPQKANATPLSLAVCVRASPWLLQLRLLHHILGVMLLSS